jgi:hypothetical protein
MQICIIRSSRVRQRSRKIVRNSIISSGLKYGRDNRVFSILKYGRDNRVFSIKDWIKIQSYIVQVKQEVYQVEIP